MKTISDIKKLIADEGVEFVDLRLTDAHGRWHHVSVPAHALREDGLQPFDGSSMPGWKGLEASDMLLAPDWDTARIDPFYAHRTLYVICDVIEPDTGAGYVRDPRSVARRAEKYLVESGVGDAAYFGPEPEFFLFDGVRFANDPGHAFFEILSDEAEWSNASDAPDCVHGMRPQVKGGYFPVPPVDSLQEVRSECVKRLEEQGVPCEIHHHEVAGAGQCEIGTRFSSLVERADWNQIFKYTVRSTARLYAKSATFMPKPVVGDNGSGMHVHQSIWKAGRNLFAGNGYAGLSQTALYYIGGIIRHARALNAITNPAINSYKRLVPGFEAPVKLAYSARNRSASIRIPLSESEAARRIEVRFPDPLANPYLAFAAMLMAGLDGIENRIDPGEAADKNLYDLPAQENARIATVSPELFVAVDALEADHGFLTRGGVFSEDIIEGYVALKREEIARYRTSVSPIEFSMYYTL